ncbi:hypothetical protein JGK44_000199 [Shewanella algae]|nr:hypothetical protein [Shewanella algae]
MQKKMIFHHPLPIDPNATSASGIRPRRMIEAFEAIGYEVFTVTGYSTERKESIKKIKRLILNGSKFEFVYSESSTMPTLLTDPNHLPLRPRLDFSFFSFLKKNGIKIGLFYRDIYWLFEGYGDGVNPLKALIAKLFYRYDLKQYHKYVYKLFLPSLKMGEYIPYVDPRCFQALPPGHSEENIPSKKLTHEKLNLLYVGGMSGHYQMHKLFEAMASLPNVNLTICTRDSEWELVKNEYELSPLNNISVVHQSGSELYKLFSVADIALLFVKPQIYREFAAPVKLYEYIGHKKPIISSAGTLTGDFIALNNIGWSIDYSACALITLLNELYLDKSAFESVNKCLTDLHEQHSWKSRALTVVNELEKEGL